MIFEFWLQLSRTFEGFVEPSRQTFVKIGDWEKAWQEIALLGALDTRCMIDDLHTIPMLTSILLNKQCSNIL